MKIFLLSLSEDPYEELVKILQECAKEKNISEKLVKNIYDFERGQTHLTTRKSSLPDLRGFLLDEVKHDDGESSEDQEGEGDGE